MPTSASAGNGRHLSAKLADCWLLDPVGARPARWAVALALTVWVGLWAAYSTFAERAFGINLDMGEAYAWSRHLDWSYAKHPPVEAWVTAACVSGVSA